MTNDLEKLEKGMEFFDIYNRLLKRFPLIFNDLIPDKIVNGFFWSISPIDKSLIQNRFYSNIGCKNKTIITSHIKGDFVCFTNKDNMDYIIKMTNLDTPKVKDGWEARKLYLLYPALFVCHPQNQVVIMVCRNDISTANYAECYFFKEKENGMAQSSLA